MSALLVLVLALPLACAGGRRHQPLFEGEWSASLYLRKVSPQPRIPGKIASQHGDVASVPAMRLTASDGTGLALRRVQVRGLIDDPLSLTELHLTFENPHDQTRDRSTSSRMSRSVARSRLPANTSKPRAPMAR